MLKSILNLEGVILLTRDKLKILNAGGNGTCMYQGANGYLVIEADAGTAQSRTEGSDRNWCCDSCCGASWTQGLGC